MNDERTDLFDSEELEKLRIGKVNLELTLEEEEIARKVCKKMRTTCSKITFFVIELNNEKKYVKEKYGNHEFAAIVTKINK